MNRSFTLIWVIVAQFVLSSTIKAQLESLIQDHLNSNDESRFELSDGLELSELVSIRVRELDVDGDGISEVFVGHGRMWTGDNNGTYWTVYSKSEEGYTKVSPEKQNIRILFNDHGAQYFCGEIDSLGGQCLIVAEEISRKDPKKFEKARIFQLKDGKILMEDLGALDVEIPFGKNIIENYLDAFSEKSRKLFFVEDVNAKELKIRGYKLDVWDSSLKEIKKDFHEFSENSPKSISRNDIAPNKRSDSPANQLQSEQKEAAEPEQSSSLLPWIITGVLLLGVFALLLKTFKGKSTS